MQARTATSLAQLFCFCCCVRLFSNSPLATAVWLTHTHTLPLTHIRSLLLALTVSRCYVLLRLLSLPLSRSLSLSLYCLFQLIIILNRQLSFVLILCARFYAHSSLRSFFAFALRSLFIIVAYCSLYLLVLLLPLCRCRCFLGLRASRAFSPQSKFVVVWVRFAYFERFIKS